MKRNTILLTAALCCVVLSIHAQTYFVPIDGNTLLPGTNFTLKDPGGDVQFPNTCLGSVTICPTTPNDKVRVTFSNLNLGNSNITMYDGLSGNYTPLANINSSNQSTFSSVTATDLMGCLTLNFTSTYSQAGGFTATVDEVVPYPNPNISNVLTLTSYAPFYTGAPVDYSLEIKNPGGQGPLLNTFVQLALSTDTFFNLGDSILLAEIDGNNAQPGQANALSGAVQLPTHISAGNYYLLAITDYYNAAGQLSGHPYISHVPLTITLGTKTVEINDVNCYTHHDTLVIGYNSNGSCNVIDSGNLGTPTYTVGVYLSTDSILSAGDVFLDSFSTYDIQANTVNNEYFNIAVPGNITPGTYYVIVKGDIDNVVTGANEQYNTSFVKVQVIEPYYDLAVNLTNILPDTIYAGSLNYLDYNLYDYSFGPTGSSTTVDFYISLSNVLDSTAILIGTSGLEASPFSYQYPLGANVPDYMSEGNYYLIAKIDAQYNYPDINLTNNVSVQPVYVVPMSYDLQMLRAFAPDSEVTTPGTSVYISASGWVKNNGLSNIGSAVIGVYFSADTIFSESELNLASTTVSVPHLDSVSFSFVDIVVPTDTNLHYLLFVADPNNTIPEFNENNNTVALPFNISFGHPDLALTSVSPDTLRAAVLQGATYVKIYYDNNSPYNEYSSIRGYISTDTGLSGDVTNNLLDEQYVYFAANQPDSIEPNFSMPNIAPGNYYFIVLADSGNTLGETTMANNKVAIPLVLRPDTVDLSFASASSATELATLSRASFSGELLNTSPAGSYDAGPTRLSVYAAMDTNLSLGGIFIGSTTINAFYNYAYFYFDDTIPAIAAGYHYLVFVCDSGNTVPETNYNNNIAWQAVTISPPAYDLYPTNAYVTGGTIYVNTSFSASCYVHDTGNAEVPINDLNVYISTDSVYQPGYRELGSYTVSNLSSGGYQNAGITVVGGLDTPGTYYLFFYADATHLVNETNENNNIISVPVTITPNSYDIILTDFSAGAIQLPVNTTITNYAIFYNASTTYVDSVYVNLYLSQDTVYQPGDILVGSLLVSQNVWSGDNWAGQVSLTVPVGTPTGTYNLVAYADANQRYNETNWQNNFKYVPVQVINSAFDLYPVTSSDTAMTMYIGNQQGAIYFDICNFGVTPSPTCQYSLYLSTDSYVDPGDTKLTTSTLQPINAMGYVYTFTNNFTVPNVTPGNYYLILYVDSLYDGQESNPNNNLAIWPVTIPVPYVDIAVCNMTMPDTVYTGTYVGPNPVNNICNLGTEESPPYDCELLFSRHPVPDSTAIRLNYSTQYYTPAHGTFDFLLNGLIPDTATPGNYYLIPFVNYTFAGPDVDSSNNYEAFPVTVLKGFVDLYIDSAYAPDTIRMNSTVSVSYRLGNDGPIGVYDYDYYAEVYLSTDSVFSTNAIALGDYYNNTLNANSSIILPGTLTPITNVTPGWYYLLFHVDSSQEYFVESNYANNTLARPVYIAPPQVDLGISSFTISTQTAVSGITQLLQATITNYTQTSTSIACAAKFYVSPDSIVNANATFLDSFEVYSISPGNYYNYASGSYNYTIPTMAPGRYYYICDVDEHDVNDDPYRANNHWAIPFEIKAPNIDLVPINFAVPNGYVYPSNNYIFTVGNNGSTATPPVVCSAWLSTNSVVNGNSYLAMTYTVPSISGPGTTEFYASIDNVNAPAGIYYLIFTVNSNDSVIETNYNNNQMKRLVSYVTNDQIYLLPDSSYSAYAVCNDTLIFAGNAAYNPTSQVTTYSFFDMYYQEEWGLYFTDFALDTGAVLNIYRGLNVVADSLQGSYTGTHSPGDVLSPPSNTMTLQVLANRPGGNFKVFYDCAAPVNIDFLFNTATLTTSNDVPTDTLDAGGVVDVYSTVQQNGGNAGYSCPISYVLSTANYDVQGDYLLQSSTVNTLSNNSVQQMDVIPIPTGLTDGPYFLLAILNRGDQISETNYNNNTYFWPVIYTSITGIQPITAQNPFYYWEDQPAKTIRILCNNGITYNSKLYDDLGQLLQQKAQVTGNIDYQVLSAGLYIIEMEQNNQLYRYKVVIY